MNLESYIKQKKDIYQFLLEYIESDNDVNFTNLFEDFQNILNSDTNYEELKSMLHLVVKIANNHHRSSTFDRKIEQILSYFSTSIMQAFSNTEIYNFFKSNKRILLFLFQKGIITVNDEIVNLILNDRSQRHFFYHEIKSQIDLNERKIIEDELLTYNEDILSNFEEKRQIGENDSYICQLIRQEKVEEFVQYVNKRNYPLSSKIKPSIFETNSFLIENKENTKLIEYAAFFGSISILQYLKMNNVQIEPSLWYFAIHSNNPELIQLLLSIDRKTLESSFDKCLIESIKCHHNAIANFIIDNFSTNEISQNDDQFNFNESITESIFQSYNFQYFPNNFKLNHSFYYLHRYYYFKMVNLYLDTIQDEIKEKVI